MSTVYVVLGADEQLLGATTSQAGAELVAGSCSRLGPQVSVWRLACPLPWPRRQVAAILHAGWRSVLLEGWRDWPRTPISEWRGGCSSFEDEPNPAQLDLLAGGG